MAVTDEQGTPAVVWQPDCGQCRACAVHHAPTHRADLITSQRFIVCPTCGNKRCPHATDHRLDCTGSNEPNQPGSDYQQRYFGDEPGGREMRHARSDYDAIQPWPTKRPHIAKLKGETTRIFYDIEAEPEGIAPIIPDDEPVFLIRGQDLAAIPAAAAWCEAAEALGADAGIIDTVRRHIELVREWQATHQAKVPDAPADALR